MAMSDTGSSFAYWTDDLYRYDTPGLGGAADSTIVASTAANATPTSPASAGSGDGSPSRAAGGPLGPRVMAGKPAARKRARASRRAPVTLLNTDASNFRAMVQQFTGIPSAPAGPYGGAPVINFGGVSGYGFAPQQQPAAAAVSFDHHLHLHQRQQQYTGAAFGYGGSSHLQQALGGGDAFAHGLGAAEDRMLLQSMQAAQMPGARTANNAANGYFA